LAQLHLYDRGEADSIEVRVTWAKDSNAEVLSVRAFDREDSLVSAYVTRFGPGSSLEGLPDMVKAAVEVYLFGSADTLPSDLSRMRKHWADYDRSRTRRGGAEPIAY
jgi:hypothetical protein